MSALGSPRSRIACRHLDILVVESDPAELYLTEMAFREAGFRGDLHCVKDGEDALMYVRRNGKYTEVPLPDIIFLNLALPKVDGLTVLKEIKQTPALLHIPIVVSSLTENLADIRAVYALNGNCFIRKPLELAEFLKFIETCYQFWSSVVTLSPKPAGPDFH